MQWCSQRRHGVRCSSAETQSAPLRVEMPEGQASRNGAGAWPRPGPGLTPVGPRTSRTNRMTPIAIAITANRKTMPKRRHHHAVRHDGVEVGRPIGLRQVSGRRDSHDGAEDRRQTETGEQVVPGERDAERARPRVLLIRLQPDLRERLRHVDAELVRRRVLARVEALAAVVTEVRQVGEVRLRERQALLHRRKHGTGTVRSTDRRCTRS